MPNCTSIDPLVTPYVDGDIGASERQLVDDHLRVCPPCHARVAAERAVRTLVCAKRSELACARASGALRARCATAKRAGPAGPPPANADADAVAQVFRPALFRPARSSPAVWRSRTVPVALAASLVLLVGGAFLYQLTAHSSRVIAAELTTDHVKCFRLMNPMLGTHDEPAAVERTMASTFGWQIHLPQSAERLGLELVGARPCLYGKGIVAHVMYRHNGQPVSVFMLPKTMRPEETVDVMGHEASFWSVGDRTFVLITSEPQPDVARLTSFVRAALR